MPTPDLDRREREGADDMVHQSAAREIVYQGWREHTVGPALSKSLMPGICCLGQICRVGPGNFTPSPSQNRT
jgi:hypothetical protein